MDENEDGQGQRISEGDVRDEVDGEEYSDASDDASMLYSQAPHGSDNTETDEAVIVSDRSVAHISTDEANSGGTQPDSLGAHHFFRIDEEVSARVPASNTTHTRILSDVHSAGYDHQAFTNDDNLSLLPSVVLSDHQDLMQHVDDVWTDEQETQRVSTSPVSGDRVYLSPTGSSALLRSQQGVSTDLELSALPRSRQEVSLTDNTAKELRTSRRSDGDDMESRDRQYTVMATGSQAACKQPTHLGRSLQVDTNTDDVSRCVQGNHTKADGQSVAGSQQRVSTGFEPSALSGSAGHQSRRGTTGGQHRSTAPTSPDAHPGTQTGVTYPRRLSDVDIRTGGRQSSRSQAGDSRRARSSPIQPKSVHYGPHKPLEDAHEDVKPSSRLATEQHRGYGCNLDCGSSPDRSRHGGPRTSYPDPDSFDDAGHRHDTDNCDDSNYYSAGDAAPHLSRRDQQRRGHPDDDVVYRDNSVRYYDQYDPIVGQVSGQWVPAVHRIPGVVDLRRKTAAERSWEAEYQIWEQRSHEQREKPIDYSQPRRKTTRRVYRDHDDAEDSHSGSRGDRRRRRRESGERYKPDPDQHCDKTDKGESDDDNKRPSRYSGHEDKDDSRRGGRQSSGGGSTRQSRDTGTGDRQKKRPSGDRDGDGDSSGTNKGSPRDDSDRRRGSRKQPDDDGDPSDSSDDDRRGRDRRRRPHRDDDPGSSDDGGKGNRRTPRRRRRASDDDRSMPRRRHLIKPEKYSGEGPFEVFVDQFQQAAIYNRWTATEKATWLRTSLTGAAAQLVCGLDVNYDEIVEKLRARFGSKGLEERYQAELRGRRRRQGESLRQLGQDIQRLLALAYPRNAETELGQIIGRDAFLASLNDYELEIRVREREPQTLEEAIKVALRIEVTHAAAGGRRSLRRVEGDRTEPAVTQKTMTDDTERQQPRESEGHSRRGRHKQTRQTVLADDKNKVDPRVAKLEKALEELKVSHQKELEAVKQQVRARQNFVRQPPPVEMQPGPGAPAQPMYYYQSQQPSGWLSGGQAATFDGNYAKSGSNRRPIRCYNCSQEGHIAKSCPEPVRNNRYYGVARDDVSQQPSPGQQEPAPQLGCRASSGDIRDAESAVYLTACVNGKVCDCLLDSGSDVTIAPSSLVSKRKIYPTRYQLTAANGTPIAVRGQTTIPFSTPHFRTKVRAIISDHVAEVMLGVDFLKQNKVKWNFDGESVELDGHPHQLVSKPQSRRRCRRVVLQEDVIVPARSQVDVLCRVNFFDHPRRVDQVSLWETEPRTIADGLICARTLTPPGRLSDVPVRIMNLASAPKPVTKGTTIAEMEAVETVTHLPTTTVPSRGSVRAATASQTDDDEMPDYVNKMVNLVDGATPESVVEGLRALLLKYRQAFSESEQDMGLTDVVTHHIDTSSARPIRQPLRKFPPAHVEAISEHVDSMMRQGVIEPAASPWAANVVLVRKKDNTYRCCIDYRQLNNVTIKDAYPLPRVDSSLDAMSGAGWFSTIDLRSSYHQVHVAPEDREKTAFICPRGMYQFKTMPFGLCNAGATFQRLMDIVMTGLHLDICLVYLDDIIVFSATPWVHLTRLETVFERLQNAGLKMKPEKCTFLQRSVSFLGHVLSAEGIATDPEKTKAVAEWPRPTSTSDVRAFVGLASYYRRFVKDFAKIAAPLHQLTQKDHRFHWAPEAEEAFQSLKSTLTSPPILVMPDDSGSFILDTDASNQSIGAVLSMEKDGVERVVAYASRSLDKREQNWCTTRKELLAVVYFVKYFKQYLLGRKFHLRTDHAALTWLRRTPDPVGQQARWLEQLEEYNYDIEHRPGTKHGNADALSRRPCKVKECPCQRTLINGDSATTFQKGPCDRPTTDLPTIAKEPLDEESDGEPLHEVRAVDSVDAAPNGGHHDDVTTWSPEGMRDAQKADPDIGCIYGLVEAGVVGPAWDQIASKSKDTKTLWSFWPRLQIRDGVLKRLYQSIDGREDVWQVVVPRTHREEFLRYVHGGQSGGHAGQKKTAAAVQMRAYWPFWSQDVAACLKKCPECARYHRGTPPKSAEMQTPLAGEPWEKISVDITGPHPRSSRQNKFILTLVDHFSKWAEAIPLQNHTAASVAGALTKHVFSRFGQPLQLLTDQGPEFESDLFSQLLRWSGVEKLRTTAYKPSTNGIVERFHRTLNAMLGKVISDGQRDWDDKLPAVMAAYRATVHSSTGYTPNKLFLGRENRMPIDLAMGLSPEQSNGDQSVDEYIYRQQELAESAYRTVREHLGRSAERRKSAYDARVRKTTFGVGQWVWYYYPRRYTAKSPKWQRNFIGPFRIVKTIPPVNYVLQKSPRSNKFVVHADKMKVCHTPPKVDWTICDEVDVVDNAPTIPPNNHDTPQIDGDGRASDSPLLEQGPMWECQRGQKLQVPDDEMDLDEAEDTPSDFGHVDRDEGEDDLNVQLQVDSHNENIQDGCWNDGPSFQSLESRGDADDVGAHPDVTCGPTVYDAEDLRRNVDAAGEELKDEDVTQVKQRLNKFSEQPREAFRSSSRPRCLPKHLRDYVRAVEMYFAEEQQRLRV